MEKKTMKRAAIMMIIGGGLIGLIAAIIKCRPLVVDMMKKKTTPTMKLEDLPTEEPSVIWEECEEG